MELKPCPFCGGKAELRCDDYINGYIVADPDYVIECEAPADQCPNFVSMKDKDHDRLVAAWNRRADLSSPLGAVAMRDVASAVVAGMAPFYIGETRFADHASLAKQIPNIPLPDHAALLAHAMRLPEVEAMVKALHFYADFHENPSDGPWGINSDDFGKVARTALEAKP